MNQIKVRKIIEVKRYILCNECLYLFEKMSKGSRFSDINCPNCNKIIWLSKNTNLFETELEALERKEKILIKREKKKDS